MGMTGGCGPVAERDARKVASSIRRQGPETCDQIRKRPVKDGAESGGPSSGGSRNFPESSTEEGERERPGMAGRSVGRHASTKTGSFTGDGAVPSAS